VDSKIYLFAPEKRWTNSWSYWFLFRGYWMAGNEEFEGEKLPYCSRGTTVIISVEAAVR